MEHLGRSGELSGIELDRMVSEERRRRGGVDKRPVPSWNFRGYESVRANGGGSCLLYVVGPPKSRAMCRI